MSLIIFNQGFSCPENPSVGNVGACAIKEAVRGVSALRQIYGVYSEWTSATVLVELSDKLPWHGLKDEKFHVVEPWDGSEADLFRFTIEALCQVRELGYDVPAAYVFQARLEDRLEAYVTHRFEDVPQPLPIVLESVVTWDELAVPLAVAM